MQSIPAAVVHEALKHAAAIGRPRAVFASRAAIARHYGVALQTVSRWIRAYRGMGVAEIAKTRKHVGTSRRLGMSMYAIKREFGSASGANAKPRTIAWIVSLRRRGSNYVKVFSVSAFASSHEALRAAQVWRDRTATEHRTLLKREIAEYVRSNNTTGVAGVYLEVRRYRKKSGKVSEYRTWVARSPRALGPKLISYAFPIAVHGERRAFKLAVDARKAWEAELRGYHVHHSAVGRLYRDCEVEGKSG